MSGLALVTGSRGFVGRHMVRALEARGYQVVGCDIADGWDMVRALEARGYQVVGCDIADGWDARQLFRLDDRRFDLVVHCAAVVGGRTMIDGEPLRLAAEDLSIDAEMFRWALRTRPGRIVAFSSSAAYPVRLQQQEFHDRLGEFDIDPDHPATPDATYGWVKLTLERLAAEANAEGIPTFVFRPFSGYGADQDQAYPFPAILRRLVDLSPTTNGVTEFEVWGHPASARDWVHIDDVVACVLAHLDADVRGPVNICTGRATTFAQLVDIAARALGRHDVRVVGNMSKPQGVFWRVGDPGLMRQVYEPRISIEQGVERGLAELRS